MAMAAFLPGAKVRITRFHGTVFDNKTSSPEAVNPNGLEGVVARYDPSDPAEYSDNGDLFIPVLFNVDEKEYVIFAHEDELELVDA